MPAKSRWLVVAAAAFAALVLTAPQASAVEVPKPWELELNDSEGPYVIQGSIGVPNVRVELVRVGSTPNFETQSSDIFSDEYTGPSGQFRVDVGLCNPNCTAFEADYQLAFHRLDLNLVPTWAPGPFTRVDAQVWTFDGPNSSPGYSVEGTMQRKVYGASSSAPVPYTTISGTVRGFDGKPFDTAQVRAFDPQKRGADSYYSYSGFRVGEMVTTGGGKYTLRVPPGKWALWFKEENFTKVKWYGCTPTQDGALYVDTTGGSVTGIDMDFSASDCGGPKPGGPDGPGGDGDGAPTKLGLDGAPVTYSDSGAATIAVDVPGAGTLTGTATGNPPKASSAARASAKKKGKGKKKGAKKLTVAKGKLTVKQAGTVKLVLKPTKAAKKLLQKGKKLKTTVKIVFKPKSGKTSTITKKVTFKIVKKKPGKKKAGKKG